jgi:type IV secretory pathway protease TraF
MMLTKAAVATAVAAALCVPAMAPAVGNVAYSVPMGLINIDNNDVQIPVQACNNNILNNVVIGVLSKNQKAKSSNKGDCKQKNKSKHKKH